MRLFATFLCSLVLLSVGRADAQPTSYNEIFSADPMYSISAGRAEKYIGTLDAQIKGFGLKVSPFNGYVISGTAGSARVDFNGRGGTAVGLFGIAEGVGIPGVRNEVVGVYGMAWKSGPYWATGLHGECILKNGEEDLTGREDEGGTCIGANIELIGNNEKSKFVGVNVQPRTYAHDVIGLQFQNPETYQYSIAAPNTTIQIGDVDTDHFCMRFEPRGQRLEFWRACNRPQPTRVGWINMNWGAPDVQLNR